MIGFVVKAENNLFQQPEKLIMYYQFKRNTIETVKAGNNLFQQPEKLITYYQFKRNTIEKL